MALHEATSDTCSPRDNGCHRPVVHRQPETTETKAFLPEPPTTKEEFVDACRCLEMERIQAYKRPLKTWIQEGILALKKRAHGMPSLPTRYWLTICLLNRLDTGIQFLPDSEDSSEPDDDDDDDNSSSCSE